MMSTTAEGDIWHLGFNTLELLSAVSAGEKNRRQISTVVDQIAPPGTEEPAMPLEIQSCRNVIAAVGSVAGTFLCIDAQ
jgi:hypothetical protein